LERLETRWLMDASVQYTFSTLNVTANDGTLNVQVALSQSQSSQVTVNYATVDGSAVAGTDYTATSGMLTFAPGSTTQTFAVTLLPNTGALTDRLFTLNLTNPSNATLGGQSSATVDIAPMSSSAWQVTGTVRSNDPISATTLPFGKEAILAQDGAVRATHPLDFNQDFHQAVSSVDTWDSVEPTAALVYLSDTVSVRPTIELNVTTDPNAALPSQIEADLTWNGFPQGSHVAQVNSGSAGSVYTTGVQDAFNVGSTGLYSWQVTVLITVGNTEIVRSVNGQTPVVVLDSSDNAIGAGWGLSGVDRLYPVSGGVIWVYGSSGYSYFSQNSDGSYQSPANDFGTLVQNGDGSWTYTSKDQIIRQFNSGGYLADIVDSHGLTATYLYDSQNRLIEVDEPDGGVTTFGYTSSLLSVINEPGNRIVTLTHSGSDLTQINDPATGQRVFTYSSHRLTNSQIAVSSNTTMSMTYSYDAAGTLSGTNAGDGVTLAVLSPVAASLGSDALTANKVGQAVFSDALGDTSTYTLDLAGRVLAVVDPDGDVQTWQRDAHGQIAVYTDALSRSTTYLYDYSASGKGDLIETIYPDGSTHTAVYDSTYHEPLSTTDSLGHTTSYTYNAQGDRITATDALNDTTTLAWSNGLLVSSTNALGYMTTYLYDSARRLTGTIDALGDRTTYTYAAGTPETNPVMTATDPDGNTTTTTYDPVAHRITVESHDTTTYKTYTGLGQVSQSTDGNGNVTQYAYDAQGRLSSTISAATSDPRTTTTLYDAAGRVTDTIDPLGRDAHYTYDAAGRLLTTTIMNESTSYAYDAAGQTIAVTDGNHNTTTYAYDLRGRVTSITDALQGVSQTVYDTEGNVLVQVDPLGRRTTFTYDAVNRTVSTTNALNQTTTVLYDVVGNVTGSIDALGRHVTSTYDAINRRISVTDPPVRSPPPSMIRPAMPPPPSIRSGKPPPINTTPKTA
jgi:YD repeat-containing protein